MTLTPDEIQQIKDSRVFTDPNIARLTMRLIEEHVALLDEVKRLQNDSNGWRDECNHLGALVGDRNAEIARLRGGLEKVTHCDCLCVGPQIDEGRKHSRHCHRTIAKKYLAPPSPTET